VEITSWRSTVVDQEEGHHQIILSDSEASTQVDACALLVLASKSSPNAELPLAMTNLLAEIFEGLKGACPSWHQNG
jgi:hypothetical protein